jgi:hypothetical protein
MQCEIVFTRTLTTADMTLSLAALWHPAFCVTVAAAPELSAIVFATDVE